MLNYPARSHNLVLPVQVIVGIWDLYSSGCIHLEKLPSVQMKVLAFFA